jgi:hypothetical protein
VTRDPRVDAYIERAQPFAQPILRAIREQVHATCPAAEEAIKWSMPAFLYKGAILCGMSAFKAHASFGLWRAEEILGVHERDGMGVLGKLTGVDELDLSRVAGLVRAGMALVDAGAKPAKPPRTPKPEIAPPPAFLDALAAAPGADAHWSAFPPGCRREYLEWIVEAKRDETRAKRIAQAVETIAAGKKLHWKYESC